MSWCQSERRPVATLLATLADSAGASRLRGGHPPRACHASLPFPVLLLVRVVGLADVRTERFRRVVIVCHFMPCTLSIGFVVSVVASRCPRYWNAVQHYDAPRCLYAKALVCILQLRQTVSWVPGISNGGSMWYISYSPCPTFQHPRSSAHHCTNDASSRTATLCHVHPAAIVNLPRSIATTARLIAFPSKSTLLTLISHPRPIYPARARS